MQIGERWRNDAKAALGANFPGRADVVSMLKR